MGTDAAPPVQLVDLSLETPDENLALDEALLRLADDAAREGETRAFLRFWESTTHFVVLGVSGRLADDVHVERCARDRVPVLRRVSGGGTVLQGPGCLNFSLVVPVASDPRLRPVRESCCYIIGSSAAALGIDGACVRGTSDLAVGDLKFGGSAQKRTPRVILHHASILHDFDLSLISRYLKEPVKQPDYRRGRPHAEFLMNLPLPADEIRSRLTTAWEAGPPPNDWDPPPVAELIAEKYSRQEWTERF